MALSYDQRKKSYESFNDSQKQQYNDLLKNKGDDYIGNQYMKQYQQATQPQTTGKAQDTRQQAYTQKQPENMDMTMEEYRKQNPNGRTVTQTSEDIQNSINQAQTNMKNQNTQVSPDLDQTKFGESTGQIRVQEGTAKQTGMPDYQAESEARNREITDNLNYYWANNRDYFSSREKFNNIFHYNDRNDSQKAILDSYWKKKEDVDYVSQFNSGESIARGMNNGQITTDQLNLLKEMDPNAYAAWQEKQEEEIKKRIINDIVPPLMDDIATQMTTMMNRLGIDPQDALDIEGAWTGMMEQTGAYQTMMDANNTVKKIEEVNNKKIAIMNRYAASTGGTVSDALAAARMAKAIAPYNEAMEGLQYQYQDYANLYNQKLATANQAAQVRQAQAQENQRIWQQRLTALGFAADAISYRTPEQQAQLKIQTQQIQNEMDLLYQSRLNDLGRYNAYATTKLQNQLQQELTDLSVEDEAQLKANLNNALSAYYDQYGDIIQRSQAQAVDDIIAYAKEKGITVAEALTKNFIAPLQNKKEYKTAVREKYGLDKYQQQYSYTIDENGNVVIKATGYGEIPEEAFKTRASRQNAYEDVYESSGSWADYVENLAGAIKDGSYGGQCGAFCNDVLIAGDQSKIFGNSLQDKIKACNVKKEDGPQVGYAVVFDLGFTSKDGINHGHVGFISAVNGDGSIDVLESNGKSDETIHVKRYSKAAVDQMVKGYYKPSNYDVQKEAKSVSTAETTENPYEGVSKATSTGANVNAGGWITDLESEYMKEKWDNKDVMNQTLNSYGISIQEYNAQKKKYLDYQAKVSLIEDTQKMYDAVKDLLTWNQEKSSKGKGSRHSGAIDLATYEAISQGTPVKNIFGVFPKYDKETANGINKYNFLKNSQLLEKYQQLKKAGATFGAMQKSEWDLVGSAANNLNWLSTDAEFESILTDMLNHYSNILADAGVPGYYSTDI